MMPKNDYPPPPSKEELRAHARETLDKLTAASDELSALLLEQHLTKEKLDSLRVDISRVSSRAALCQIDYDDALARARDYGVMSEEAEYEAAAERADARMDYGE